MRRNHVLSASALAVAAGLLLSACAGGSNTTSTFDENAEPVSGGTFTFGLNSDLDCVDPQQTGSSVAALVSRNVLDSLVGHTENNEFTPWLAESWEVSDDATSYTFSLRDGVTFSDGTPLDADAVKFNLDRIFDPATKSNYARSLLGPLREVTAVDPTTVRVDFTAPYPSFLQGASLPFLGIESPTHLRGTDNAECTTVVGSGPFVLDSYTKGVGFELSKRDDYNWGPGYADHTGAAYLDRLNFRILPENSTRLGSLENGEVDAIAAVPSANAPVVDEDPNLQLIKYENPGVNYGIFLNTQAEPFTDVRVRKAFQSALNSPELVQSVFFGQLAAADNVLGPKTPYYDSSIAQTWGFDADQANSLLDEAGWTGRDADGYRTKDGQRLTVRFPYDSSSYFAENAPLLEAFQDQIKRDVGFDLVVEPIDTGTWTDRAARGDYEAAAIFFVRPEPDILRTVFLSTNTPPNGGAYARNTDPALDELLTRGAATANGPDREQIYADVQREVIDEAYYVPVYVQAYRLGASNGVHGIKFATNASPLFYDAFLTD
ncbi:ABC transporter substrate-binding protein [Rhodococcus sp. 15-649-1-2]|uniref:ABC transporter substrate-binding protein n=1 Tax=Rhodococcus sp. 114MFTsu3.1 TaxID=1172184 RepID=UPI00036B1564|nr:MULTISPECIES: ABC transporter substrate-binding protein [unclassified Rhodococcus (in: high G+C Gram-positive bacteria)]OZC86761.1 ABC transporter substrate-binding protein [Rhodococcus sp. 06-418-1B]OZE82205.1 ABC transporter substrate-binding protein [Rhodococcus sp. 15-649-1-2]